MVFKNENNVFYLVNYKDLSKDNKKYHILSLLSTNDNSIYDVFLDDVQLNKSEFLQDIISDFQNDKKFVDVSEFVSVSLYKNKYRLILNV